jgi:hypothetical protein
MKNKTLFFILRLFFYLSVAAIVLLHPGIVISYDSSGLVQWFIIIPFGALIGFLPGIRSQKTGGRLKSKFIFAFFSLGIISILAGGWSPSALPLFFSGWLSFCLSLLLFHYPGQSADCSVFLLRYRGSPSHCPKAWIFYQCDRLKNLQSSYF